MNDIITQLAIDLDAFEYDYDYYGYMDAVDDRLQAIIDLKRDLIRRQNVGGIIEYLTEIIDEADPEWSSKALALKERLLGLPRYIDQDI